MSLAPCTYPRHRESSRTPAARSPSSPAIQPPALALRYEISDEIREKVSADIPTLPCGCKAGSRPLQPAPFELSLKGNSCYRRDVHSGGPRCVVYLHCVVGLTIKESAGF